MGSDVWLRSAEANIQLEGSVRVSKVGQDYSPVGTLTAARGSYTLKIGPVTRDFTVARGEVSYIGDLNAGLDIQARHVVRTVRTGDEIPVIANITGTLYQPKVSAREHLPAADLGDGPGLLPHHGLSGERGRPGGPGGRAPDGALLFLERALQRAGARPHQDFGVPIDLIEIRPGVSSSAGTAGTFTQLAAGWQIGKKTFLTFSAGFCPDFSQLRGRTLGASLEFRFSREWKLQSSVEPTVQSCGS